MREQYVKRHIAFFGCRASGEGKIPRHVYLTKAAELITKVDGESDPALKAEYENLARAYLLLAEQAERNDRTDIVYETPDNDRDQP